MKFVCLKCEKQLIVVLGKRYGVIGEPWLFLIDKDGVVRYIFKGFTGREAIESELKKILEGGR